MAASFSQIQRKEQERDREKERKSCGGSGGEFFTVNGCIFESDTTEGARERKGEGWGGSGGGAVFNSV